MCLVLAAPICEPVVFGCAADRVLCSGPEFSVNNETQNSVVEPLKMSPHFVTLVNQKQCNASVWRWEILLAVWLCFIASN